MPQVQDQPRSGSPLRGYLVALGLLAAGSLWFFAARLIMQTYVEAGTDPGIVGDVPFP